MTAATASAAARADGAALLIVGPMSAEYEADATCSPVAILHLDAHCIVAIKPAGLLTVPGRGAGNSDCLAARIQARHADALIVHRLDMATSGLVVLARGAAAHRHLGMAFAARAVEKTYIAIVDGLIADDAGEIDLPLIADWPNRPRQIVDLAQGKPSLTRYRVLARDVQAGRTRIELMPVTGRSHQLRVHLQAIGHPILGDALYAPASVQAAADRLLLHATALSFPHPGSGMRVDFASAAPF